jgi:hypothetical protein
MKSEEGQRRLLADRSGNWQVVFRLQTYDKSSSRPRKSSAHQHPPGARILKVVLTWVMGDGTDAQDARRW